MWYGRDSKGRVEGRESKLADASLPADPSDSQFLTYRV